MAALLIAIGNVFRRDDGAARRVLELLGPLPGARTVEVMQLSPEMAEDIAAAGRVVFIDADVNPGPARLEPAGSPSASRSPLAHALHPEEALEYARRLYGFKGEAWICRVPGTDFSTGEGLSAEAETNAREAAGLIRKLFR